MERIRNSLRQYGPATLFQFTPIAQGVTQSSKLTQLYSGTGLVNFFQNLFVFALTLGAIFAVVRIIYAGYLYMGSGDMWSNKKQATETFRETVLGVLLLLGIWLILNQIDPNLLNLDILGSENGNKVTGLSAQQASQPGAQGGSTNGGGCSLTDPDTGACLVPN